MLEKDGIEWKKTKMTPESAKMNQTIDDLKNAVEKFDSINDIIESDEVHDDFSAITVDFENLEPFGTEDSYNHLPGLENCQGYEMLSSGKAEFPVLWCACGGDWELPLVFVLYIDAYGDIRAYVPEDGNAYNHERKAAYGNNEGDPAFGDGSDSRYMFDIDKMKADIVKNLLKQ